MGILLITEVGALQTSGRHTTSAQPLRQVADTLGIQLVPVDHERLAFHGLGRQWNKAQVGDRREGLTSSTGDGTVQFGLGHVCCPFEEMGIREPPAAPFERPEANEVFARAETLSTLGTLEDGSGYRDGI